MRFVCIFLLFLSDNIDEGNDMKEYSTRAKTTILDIFKNNPNSQLSAAQVYEMLSKDGSVINLATVYRNLDRMCEEKVIIKFKAIDNSGFLYKYAQTTEGLHCFEHLHLQCKKCGKMIHLDCDFMKEISGHLLKHHDFMVACEGSVIMGLCKDCRDERE